MVTRHDPGSELKTRLLGMLRNPPPIPQTNGPLLLTVSIAKQTITLYDAGVEIAKAPISSGTTAMPTPMGVFSVLEKNWWHRSNMYSAAPMPFMQRITWSGVALHAGELPGYRASHGCVRLTDSFALRLWYTTRIGARVVIAWDEVAPYDIAHPLLFQPKAMPQPTPAPQEQAPPPAAPPADSAMISMNAPSAVPSEDDPRDQTESVPPIFPSFARSGDDDPALDHMMTAARDDGEATDDSPRVADATSSIDYALSPSRPANDLIALEEHLAPVAALARQQSDADTPVTLARLETIDTPHRQPLFDSFAIARRKIAPRRWAGPVTTSPAEPEQVLRPGPISVLISRKDRRIYVRKGLQPVFDAPIGIAQVERPFGTHVFTAVAVDDDGANLRWKVASPSAEPRGRAGIVPTAAASAALDRIAIPQETLDRIAALTTVGATLIVSDPGLGRTAKLLDSDFTVLMR